MWIDILFNLTHSHSQCRIWKLFALFVQKHDLLTVILNSNHTFRVIYLDSQVGLEEVITHILDWISPESNSIAAASMLDPLCFRSDWWVSVHIHRESQLFLTVSIKWRVELRVNVPQGTILFHPSWENKLTKAGFKIQIKVVLEINTKMLNSCSESPYQLNLHFINLLYGVGYTTGLMKHDTLAC